MRTNNTNDTASLAHRVATRRPVTIKQTPLQVNGPLATALLVAVTLAGPAAAAANGEQLCTHGGQKPEKGQEGQQGQQAQQGQQGKPSPGGQQAPSQKMLDDFKQASDEQLARLGETEQETRDEVVKPLEDLSLMHEIIKDIFQPGTETAITLNDGMVGAPFASATIEVLRAEALLPIE